MSGTGSVTVIVPADIAEEAAEIQRADPTYLAREVTYAVMRAGVRSELRHQDVLREAAGFERRLLAEGS